ncbi:hypothetical protein TNCV_3742231 [Trichonephila clavipes]|nr:hypothetical protein TNCV_3742231 [Trichonephila clavipes]
MDYWHILKSKNAELDDTSSKQGEIISSSQKKLCLFSKDYRFFGFTYTSSADEQLPQCVSCFILHFNEEKISEEDTMGITQHLLNYCEYLPVSERKNNWIRDPFAVDVCEQTGRPSVEEQLIEISRWSLEIDLQE